MEKFFYAKSVAVVGVSSGPTNLARGIVANLLEFGYQGKIFPVGRSQGEVFGLQIYPGLEYLSERPDVVAILTPARFIPDLVAQCAELGISRIVVESAGFSELSEEGKVLEDEIRGHLKQYGMRLVGPNGLGLMNMENGLALPFAQFRPLPLKGRISVISQSGGVASHLFAWMAQEGLGLNKFLSLGNKLDVNENEMLTYLLDDPGTEAIYIYLEGLSDGRGLLEAARGAGKPIFLHAANVGPETATIAHSHTASLTADERVLEAACRQTGMLNLKRQSDFLCAAKLVGQPPVKGSRVVVLSRTGGQAVIAAYACRHWGFRLPPISESLAHLIRERSRAGVINPTNPIDLGDVFDFTLYEEIVAAVCRDPEVDALLLNFGPMADFEVEAGRQMARHVVEQARAAEKPLAISVVCTIDEEEFFRRKLKVPVFHFPEEAVQALAYSRDRAALAATRNPAPAPRPLPEAHQIAAILASAATDGFLSLPQALTLTAALGIPVAPWQSAGTSEEAIEAAQSLGFPVVLKLAAPSLVHKTEAGAVLLDLGDADAVRAGFANLAQVARSALAADEPWEVLVMRQAPPGPELLLGARRDQAFGPVVAFGAGGIATEILDDASLRVSPIGEPEALSLMEETRIGRVLAGIRGRPGADLAALARGLASLSELMMHFPQIQEVDLNPVIAYPGQEGFLALDVRIRVGGG